MAIFPINLGRYWIMGKRKRFRNRGRRKQLKKDALKTWERLKYVPKPKTEWERILGSKVIPVIRKVVPSMIAEDIVSVQPMQSPTGEKSNIEKTIELDIKKTKITPKAHSAKKSKAKTTTKDGNVGKVEES